MPEISNSSGKSKVVGYCHIKPNRENGEITAKGASFFWENGRVGDSAGFTSVLVHCSKEAGEEITCHIHFNINPEDSGKRTYHHGVLIFQLVTNATASTDKDVYAGFLMSHKNEGLFVGYLKSHKKDSELNEKEVRAKGYAEWYCKGCVSEKNIHGVLEENGDMLFAKLDGMLEDPPPPLWKSMDHYIINYWNRQIPTPQSVILNHKLHTQINEYLSKVLALFGLDGPAISRFQMTVAHIAKKEKDDTLVAYERALKRELTGLTKQSSESKALNDRAKIIYSEIKDFLVGDSLLDIGCGNGLISNLSRNHFKQKLLLDVVEYVPEAFNLDFKLYKEGQPLPISEPFDTVFLLTVLHHSKNPEELLKLAWGATKKRLIIIESVIGVHQVTPPVRYELANSDIEDQIGFAAFVDWFYNRVLHDDVPVPYNFTTVDDWESTFSKNKMRLARTIHFGQDIEIGPEYHVLFVLEKE
jgi:SAM-dependent methyltransferase